MTEGQEEIWIIEGYKEVGEHMLKRPLRLTIKDKQVIKAEEVTSSSE